MPRRRSIAVNTFGGFVTGRRGLTPSVATGASAGGGIPAQQFAVSGLSMPRGTARANGEAAAEQADEQQPIIRGLAAASGAFGRSAGSAEVESGGGGPVTGLFAPGAVLISSGSQLFLIRLRRRKEREQERRSRGSGMDRMAQTLALLSSGPMPQSGRRWWET